MDISTIIGLVAGAGFMIYGIGLANIGGFIDVQSLIITVGGTFASMFIGYPLKNVIASVKAYGHIFKITNLNETFVIKKIIELSNVARKEGLLALEEVANELDDAFLKKGILLIVDGTDPELVRSIMETELSFLESRHKGIQGFWETLASLGPAWGMIGTLIGLINMLGALDDPGAIGPAMAIALITTLYGSILANFIANPAANKMKIKSASEVLLKEVMIEGLLSIQAGENPRVIEEKLKAFLSPTQRAMFETTDEKVGEE
ncbi:MAG: ytxD [Clostridiales bacterium]|jgi:chemotaxis protein MotA|nr:ytxD [Clostridiales bacterium]